jgi:uncharacterized protein YjbI with pentapeptide repeats
MPVEEEKLCTQQWGEQAQQLLNAYAHGQRRFSRWNLAGCDLRGVTLTDSDMRGVCLAGANLQEAQLDRAILAGADLTDADLAREPSRYRACVRRLD